MHTSLLAIALLISGLRSDATTLTGRVLLNHIGGAPVSGIRVKAVGSKSALTDAGGTFLLEFPKNKPEVVVQLSVDRPGYTIINSVQLLAAFSKANDHKVLTIILCKEQQYEECVRRLHKSMAFKAIDRHYEASVRQLKGTREEKGAELVRLQKSREQAIGFFEQPIHYSNSVKLLRSLNLYSEATSMFVDGEVTPAIRSIDEARITSLLKVKNTGTEKGDQSSADTAAENLRLKATMLITQFQFDEAERLFKLAVQIAPESTSARFDFGNVERVLDKVEAARSNFEEGLDLARQSGNEDAEASAVAELSMTGLGREQAQVNLDKALALYSKLAEVRPKTYDLRVAQTQYAIALMKQSGREFSSARQGFLQVLGTLRELEKQNPGLFLPELASTLNALGNLDRTLGKTDGTADQSLKFLTESLSIYRRLAHTDPEGYFSYMAMALNNLASLEQFMQHPEKARRDLENAIEVISPLGLKYAGSYLLQLATYLASLGALDMNEGRISLAYNRDKSSLSDLKQLIEHDRKAFLPALPQVLFNLGSLSSSMGNVPQARDYYQQCLDTSQELSVTDSSFRVWMGRTEDALAGLEKRSTIPVTEQSAPEHLGNLVDGAKWSVVQIELELTDPRDKTSPNLPTELQPRLEDTGGFIDGTGVIINSDSDILTAAHVVQTIGNIQNELSSVGIESTLMVGVPQPNIDSRYTGRNSSASYSATVKFIDRSRDIAILHPSVKLIDYSVIYSAVTAGIESKRNATVNHSTPLKMALEKARDQDSVVVCGFPGGSFRLITRPAKIASASVYEPLLNSHPPVYLDVYKIDIKPGLGDSGGPLLRQSDGAIVGMVVQTGDAPSGLGTVIPSTTIIKVLNENKILWEPGTNEKK